MKLPIAILVVILCGFSFAEDEELMAKVLSKAKECVKEGSVDMGVCKEMWNEGVNEDDPKYASCKCVVACMSKKFGTMDSTGTYQRDKFSEYKDKLPDEDMKKEAERVFPICYETIGDKKDCDAGYTFLKCGVKTSSMVKDICKMMMDGMEKEN